MNKLRALPGGLKALLVALALTFNFGGLALQKSERPRARDVGLRIGVLPTGSLNAITDVAGVQVGQTTIIRGDDIRTGLTAIVPHAGNLFREKVPGAVFIGNAFGKLAGSTQVNELGEIETPIVLTSTLSVPRVADAVLDYLLALPGNEDVRSTNLWGNAEFHLLFHLHTGKEYDYQMSNVAHTWEEWMLAQRSTQTSDGLERTVV